MAYRLPLTLLVSAILSFKISTAIDFSCPGGNIFTITNGPNNTIYQQNCSSSNQNCDVTKGCVTPSPSEVGFFMNCTDIGPTRFSKLGDCSSYYECDGEATVFTTEVCPTDAPLYHPGLRTCVPSAFFNASTTCYRGLQSCRLNSSGLIYNQPHPYDPFVYIACVNDRILFTAGCTTYYDIATRGCAT